MLYKEKKNGWGGHLDSGEHTAQCVCSCGVGCIGSCMFLHILPCYRSVVSRVATSKILKNCISITASVHFVRVKSSCDPSAEVFEDELVPQRLGLAVPVLGSLVQALGRLQGVRPLQGPGVQSRLQGGVVENAAGQHDGRAPLWGVLQRRGRGRSG